jgi:hypothetical protein
MIVFDGLALIGLGILDIILGACGLVILVANIGILLCNDKKGKKDE